MNGYYNNFILFFNIMTSYPVKVIHQYELCCTNNELLKLYFLLSVLNKL